ncbi:hypothetical protein BDK51DRAFT_39890 [Blyttiomyces helicus]|uniref:Uncharacterized protein n=1 Tax=Blyttiomyces helicus TaxID=388810 RepID=A0A4V1IQY5_9FUNG|nr:hypothetical protein BDK51DRAFT_39890 [Blyttiomyces helicus]|eukprot:RKO88177.1 hypothetical protein BDK51DRAFT_39890 [Blyttiomyces helicus]
MRPQRWRTRPSPGSAQLPAPPSPRALVPQSSPALTHAHPDPSRVPDAVPRPDPITVQIRDPAAPQPSPHSHARPAPRERRDPEGCDRRQAIWDDTIDAIPLPSLRWSLCMSSATGSSRDAGPGFRFRTTASRLGRKVPKYDGLGDGGLPNPTGGGPFPLPIPTPSLPSPKHDPIASQMIEVVFGAWGRGSPRLRLALRDKRGNGSGGNPRFVRMAEVRGHRSRKANAVSDHRSLRNGPSALESASNEKVTVEQCGISWQTVRALQRATITCRLTLGLRTWTFAVIDQMQLTAHSAARLKKGSRKEGDTAHGDWDLRLLSGHHGFMTRCVSIPVNVMGLDSFCSFQLQVTFLSLAERRFREATPQRRPPSISGILGKSFEELQIVSNQFGALGARYFSGPSEASSEDDDQIL